MDVERLDRFALLSMLPAEEKEVLARVLGEVSFDAGHTLASTGDFGYALYAVEEGSADVLDADGNLLRALGPGDTFGEVALILSGRRSATVRTTTPLRALTLFARDFLRVRDQVPTFESSMREIARQHVAG